MREHLDVDAGLVHFLEAQRAEIEQLLDLQPGRAGLAAGKGLGELLVPIVLLERDHRTMRFLEHACLPVSATVRRGAVARA